MTEIYEKIDNDIKSRLSDGRYCHSVCVAKAAKYLAEKYGADVQEAELAGIAHDVFKELSKEEMFSYFEKYGIQPTEIEKSAPKLWHAMGGSAYLENEYSLPEGIVTAVRYHTTGRTGMSLLEKILYVADFISDDRNYDGVEEMRARADVSLENAMLEGLRFTVEELAVKCVPIHPDTFEAYNEITLENKQ